MKHLSSLSIFFPALNDAPTLPSLIARANAAAKKVTNDFEIIVVNDGSTDETSTIIKSLQKKYPKLRLVMHRATLGYGGALRSGFAHATKDFVFYTDGDGQYDPGELVFLVKALTKGIGAVNGYKVTRQDNWMRNIFGSLYNALVHTIFSLPIRDIDCDFRLIQRSVLEHIDLRSSSGAICLELVLKLAKRGTVFREIPVHHFPRQFGRSQFFRIPWFIKTAKELVHLWYDKDRL